MSVAKRGARAGAAAFVLGMSLAGPQALGVAAADNNDVGDSNARAGASSGASAKGPRSEKVRPGPSRITGPSAASATRGAGSLSDDDPDADGAPVAGAAGAAEISASIRQSMPTPGRRLRPQTVDLAPSPEIDLSRVTGSQSAVPATPGDRMVHPAADDSSIIPEVSPASAVAGSGVIVSHEAPAASTVPTTFLGAVDAVVTNLFEATQDFVAWLPSSHFSAWLEGALSQLRRKWFNHAPSANVVQHMQGPDSVVGKILATDPEQEAITYTVLTGPTNGTVTVDSKGTFHYDATTRFEGTDSFVVAVDNPNRGRNLLAPIDGPTLVTVTVNGTFKPLLQAQTEGFVIYNLSSRRLQYQGSWGQAENDDNPFETAPREGLILEPGDSLRVEVEWGGGTTDASLFFTTLDDPFGRGAAWYGMWLQNENNQPDVEKTESSEDTADIDWDEDVENDVTAIRLMDEPGLKLDATNGTPEQVENALRIFRNMEKNNVADVTYTPAGKPRGSLFNSKDFRKVWVTSGDPYFEVPNDDSLKDLTFNEQVGFTATESASTSVTSALSADILMMVSASVEMNYSSSLEKSHTYSRSITKEISPNSVLQIFTSHRTLRVTGDMEVRYGNTTLIVGGVDYDTPDPSVEATIYYKVIPLKDWKDPSKA